MNESMVLERPDEMDLQEKPFDPRAVKPDRGREISDALDEIAGRSNRLFAGSVGRVRMDGREWELPRFVYDGPLGGGDPIRIGVFAGIHGDEPAGSYAIVDFVKRLEAEPELARDFRLHFYPVCNPTGFEAGTRCSRRGKDLNREFWKNSPEPEIALLEPEIRSRAFHGLISLHADDTSDGIYGFVRGAVLTRALLEPALLAAERILPRNRNSTIDGFPAENGVISECYDGILTSPPELDPLPFEIIWETPSMAPLRAQVEASVAALGTILAEYRKLLAFAVNI